MKTSRRKMLAAIAAVPFALHAAEEPAPEPPRARGLLGSWFVTSGQLTFVFSFEPNGEALVLFFENGSFNIARHPWRPMPGGAVIDTMPRFRFWLPPVPGSSCDVRVEMEELPADADVSDGFRHFPLRFCMKRVTHAPLPKALLERPLPKNWEQPAVDEDWDAKAGQRR